MKKYVAEFIGTFFLMAAIGLAVFGNAGEWTPAAIGLTLLAMIYATGHVSKAHFNPAVTVGFWIRGELDVREIIPYFLAEFGGAVAGAFLAAFLYNTTGTPVPETDLARVFVAELFFTFALVFVIMSVATAEGAKGNQFYGAAIAAIVVGGILCVGDISGAVFNPCVAIGMLAVGLKDLSTLWVFLVAQFLGGALAVLVFNQFHLGEDES